MYPVQVGGDRQEIIKHNNLIGRARSTRGVCPQRSRVSSSARSRSAGGSGQALVRCIRCRVRCATSVHGDRGQVLDAASGRDGHEARARGPSARAAVARDRPGPDGRLGPGTAAGGAGARPRRSAGHGSAPRNRLPANLGSSRPQLLDQPADEPARASWHGRPGNSADRVVAGGRVRISRRSPPARRCGTADRAAPGTAAARAAPRRRARPAAPAATGGRARARPRSPPCRRSAGCRTPSACGRRPAPRC